VPILKGREGWEIAFVDQVKELAATQNLKGLSVKPHLGRVRLRYRQSGQKETGVTLPFEWRKSDTGDAYTRIRNIVALMAEGREIKNAALIAEGRSPSKRLNWADVVKKFEIEKTEFGNGIKPVTWRSDYLRPLNELIELMADKDAPVDGNSLLEALIIRYEAGSRTRTIRVDAITSFLKFCLERHDYHSIWLPTKERKNFIGRASANRTRVQSKNKTNGLTDDLIIELISNIPDSTSRNKWKNVLKLMIVFGLRGIAEVDCLEVAKDPVSAKLFVKCNYAKRSGNGVTEPRKLRELPPIDSAGNMVDWNVATDFIHGKLELPNLDDKFALQQFLKRQEAWVKLKDQLEQKGFRLQAKHFRDAYSLRAHMVEISAESVAESMGHSYDTHLRHYPWASESRADEEFDRAKALLE